MHVIISKLLISKISIFLKSLLKGRNLRVLHLVFLPLHIQMYKTLK